MTANQATFKCLDWKTPELALRSRDLQNIDILFMSCVNDLPFVLPQFEGISKYTEDYDINPEWWILFEKECGTVPEGADRNRYHT